MGAWLKSGLMFLTFFSFSLMYRLLTHLIISYPTVSFAHIATFLIFVSYDKVAQNDPWPILLGILTACFFLRKYILPSNCYTMIKASSLP